MGTWCCCARHRMAASGSQTRREYATSKFDRNLRGIKRIAFVANLTIICSWFLSFCALTWASAVLLGAYVSQLSMWDYYDVSLLLFIDGIRFGLAATVRFLGYRLWDCVRWALRSVSFFLPLGMGGFAVLSMLPRNIRHSIHLRFGGHSSRSLLHRHLQQMSDHASEPAAGPAPASYRSLSPSLNIFYILILSNAFVLLLGTSITDLLRQRYVRSTIKSLSKYYDEMINSTTSWFHPPVDLHFAFEILGSQYRKGRNVCVTYADLICYMYIHEKGVEAAEAALDAEDGCVREAAANIVGFWAVLETLIPEEVKKHKHRLPLCFQRRLLSRLAGIAAESYGSLGTAAAQSFRLLLELVDPDLIGIVACVSLRSTGKDIIDVLLGRAAELLRPQTYKLPTNLKEASCAHIYALRQYLHRLQNPKDSTRNGAEISIALIEAQQALVAKKIKNVFPQRTTGSSNQRHTEIVVQGSTGDNGIYNRNEIIIQGFIDLLQRELPLASPASPTVEQIRACFQTQTPPPSWKSSPLKATFLLLFNVAFPLGCVVVGFILNAIL